MAYKYSALDASSQLVSGYVDASDEVAAEEALGQQGYRVLTLKAHKPVPALEKLMPSFFRVKAGQIIIMSRQLAALLEAGIDIVAAIEILKEQAPSGSVKSLFDDMVKKLRAGNQLGVVLRQFPAVFPPTYVKMIEVGEQTGNIEGALKQASAYIEKQREAGKKLSKALMYPGFVGGVAVVVVILLMVLVLPAMSGMFASLGAELPLPTRMLMATSGFLKTNILVLLLIIAALGVLLYIRLRSKEGRRQLDGILLKIPVLGNIIIFTEIARFAGTVSILLQAGVTVSASAELGASTCKNKVIKEALEKATEELLQGHGLSGPLSRAKLFPSMLIQMVRVGEETGSLNSTLSVVANAYETEVNERSQAMLAMLEPALTVAISILVGFIAISVIMPIYSILGTIK